MVKQIVYFYDTGWSVLTGTGTGTTITDYSTINSGDQYAVAAISTGLAIGKAVTTNPSLSKQNATKYYEEGKAQYNSVGNRTFTVSGVLDTEVTADQTSYSNLLLMIRSPAIFGFKTELTIYDDDPNVAQNQAGQSEFGSGLYVYVVPTNLTATTNAEDRNIIDYRLELVLVND